MTDADREKRLAEIEGWKEAVVGLMWKPDNSGLDWPPHYLTDANAVLRVLETCWWDVCYSGAYYLKIEKRGDMKQSTVAYATTFCRAACLAIVAAHEGRQA